MRDESEAGLRLQIPPKPTSHEGYLIVEQIFLCVWCRTAMNRGISKFCPTLRFEVNDIFYLHFQDTSFLTSFLELFLDNAHIFIVEFSFSVIQSSATIW